LDGRKQMENRSPSRDEWSNLYDAAIDVKEMAPWGWMEETEVFGVQNPETNDLGFVSVMGALGEHLSVAVYQGPKGLYGFWSLLHMEDTGTGVEILRIPHLQASFGGRGELTERDREVIKRLGLKFRGRQAWPLFRSYRPGYFPYYVEAHEARFLTHALEQTLEVAPRIKEEPRILEPGAEEEYLVRVAREERDGLIWEDQVVSVLPPEPEPITMFMDSDALERLREIPRQPMSVEIDMFVYPARIGERGTRLRYAYQLLAVESRSGFVLGSEMLMPDPTEEAMYGQVPAIVARLLARAGVVPREMRVRSPLLFQLLESLADDLRITVIETPKLPALDQAVDFVRQRGM
jgi:hypothetical protein